MKYLKISGYLLLIGCFIMLVFINKCTAPEPDNKEGIASQKIQTKPLVNQIKDSLPLKNICSSKNEYCRDIALLIAGLKPHDAEIFKTIINSQGWLSYKKNIDFSWEQFQNQKLQNIKEWKKKYLKNINEQTENLLYPFSGPDFIYANAFVPDVEIYFLF